MRDPALSASDEAFLDAFRRRYPFVLDPFQERAIRLIASGSSVIVSAPTGAGKTLIAEFAMLKALQDARRIVYTTPIKALSNQKYADFCRQFGDAHVGLLTGDVKVNSSAAIVVMTTEILRNMLYLEPPEHLGYVVLDECHYMGDEGRGTVWEEIIINCPKDVPLIALSATVSNIQEIAAWITEVHRPIVAIHHPRRPVPLQYLLVDPTGKIIDVAEAPPQGGRPREHEGRRSHQHRGRGPDANTLILHLQARRLLPAIYFIFSRAGCEAALYRLLGARVPLLEAAGREAVEEAIDRTLYAYPSVAPHSPLNQLILQGLRQGVGIHHAGILPALKRLTEILFERGLVKVVFATETMSLGIHMPARSVVLQELRKRGDLGFRTLQVRELMQMAGRAGRRGIDPEGTCLIATDDRVTPAEAMRLVRGKPEPIESRFRIGYSSAALLLRSYPDPRAIRQTIERSFGEFQTRRRIRELDAQWQQRFRQLARRAGLKPPCCDLEDFVAYQLQRRLSPAEPGEAPAEGRRRGRRKRAVTSPWQEMLRSARAQGEISGSQRGECACQHCPERHRLEQLLQRSQPLRSALEQRLSLLAQLRDTYWDQFLRAARVLEHFRYQREGVLSPEGRLVASLRHDNELLVARVVFSGILDDLTPPELAALLSCLSEEPREREASNVYRFLAEHPHLRDRVKQMQQLAEELLRVQQSHRVTLPVAMHLTYMVATYRWASGDDTWLSLVEDAYGGHEGDLIRAFRRLIDLARQLAEYCESPPLQERLWQVVACLDRGIVLESALL